MTAESLSGSRSSCLKDRCTILSSDQWVGLAGGERYVYPDLSVVYGTAMLEEATRDVLANPMLLVEVLSASTEQYDRGLKWEGYQRLPSLTDYLLVSQTARRIEHFRRGADGGWAYRAAGLGERLELTNGGALDIDSIFDGVFELPSDE